MKTMSLKSLSFLLLVLCLSRPGFSGDKDRARLGCPASSRKFTSLRSQAESGDATAQAVLASCYELGRHVAPSRAETIHWLTLSAGQGYAPAEYELGRIYLFGRGIPADYEKARQWLMKAAEQGHSQAGRNVAFIYERGLGVEVDLAEAAVWNRKAAGQGEPEAQLRLAQALEEGKGVTMNAAEARDWYLRAARQDVVAAQLRLARLYDRAGNRAAMEWYEKAAGRGDSTAMFELGQVSQSGRYGPADRERAYFWFQLAGRFGSKESQARADTLAAGLTGARKQRIDKSADAWIRRHPGADKEEDEEREREGR
jgi:TPR repeat protein